MHDMHTADIVAEMLIIMASNEKKYELPLQVIKSQQMGLNLWIVIVHFMYSVKSDHVFMIILQ